MVAADPGILPRVLHFGAGRRDINRSLSRRLIAIRYWLLALLLAATLSACASPDREPGVPLALTDRAAVLGGLPNVRYFADTQVPDLTREAYAALDRERAQLGPVRSGPFLIPGQSQASR